MKPKSKKSKSIVENAFKKAKWTREKQQQHGYILIYLWNIKKPITDKYYGCSKILIEFSGVYHFMIYNNNAVVLLCSKPMFVC